MKDETHKGLIAWFARNEVAANLLMILIIAVGIASMINMKKEIFPPFATDTITVVQAYPGAGPKEVEEGIILKIEDSLKDLTGIKRMESRSFDSVAQVIIETQNGYDLDNVLNEVKIQIDSISTFPEEAEKPIVSKIDHIVPAVQLQLTGAITEKTGKELGEEIKKELLALDDVGKVDMYGARDFEITIEVAESDLRKYGLTLSRVADVIRRSSIDLPAGSIRSDSGDIVLRTSGQAYRQQEFEQLVLLTFEDGTRLTLGDIATIDDGFIEVVGFSSFDKKYSIAIVPYATGDQDILVVGKTVKAYMAEKAKSLPEGVEIHYWADSTYYLNERLSLMMKNLGLGAFLVFLTLSLFMELRMAFWVMIGLPICFLGALAFMPAPGIDVSINMMSLFGFILVLGIVVDDAIIIGESIHQSTRREGHTLEAVIRGAQRVAMPATFGVLTTIVAFAPNLFIGGVFANLLNAFGSVVILCLIFSLVESKWILPAHLAHTQHGLMRYFHSKRQDAFQKRNNTWLDNFVEHSYKPFLHKTLANRYTSIASFFAVLIIVLGLIAGGWIRYVMMEDIPGDYLKSNLEMVRGTPEEKTREAIYRIARAIDEVEQEYLAETGSEQSFIKHIYMYSVEGRIGAFMLELTRDTEREIGADEIMKRWRDKTGNIPGAKILSFSELSPDSDSDLEFNLVGSDVVELEAAANDLVAKLETYHGVYDIKNGAADLINEIHLDIKPSAEALGLTLADVGRQVRDAFYGAEAQRIQRDNSEIKVMVRYPKTDRKTIADLENLYIRTPDGTEVPLTTVAELSLVPGYAEFIRVNRERAVPIQADVDEAVLEPSKIVNDIVGPFVLEQKEKYPGVSYRLGGDISESAKMERDLAMGFALALFGIYALLAIPLKSYAQPLIIMSVIPFGLIGASVGHMVFGKALSMMSFMGFIALTGVVVNDSLILIEFINRARAQGQNIVDAVVSAGSQRLRAILLTSMTTFLGILPMMLETSGQAAFMQPMAISLGFGIVFSTVITLLLVPNLYMVLDELKHRSSDFLNRTATDSGPA